MDYDENDGKRHDLALRKLQRASDKWKQLNLINKRLHEKN